MAAEGSAAPQVLEERSGYADGCPPDSAAGVSRRERTAEVEDQAWDASCTEHFRGPRMPLQQDTVSQYLQPRNETRYSSS